jgi:hypothetical protein
MFKIAWFSGKLFFKGKLFRDPMDFIKQIAIATIVSSLILVTLALVKIPLLLAVAISSILTGIMMPFLFKDFKMQ